MKTNSLLKDVLLYSLAYLLWVISALACAAAVVQFREVLNVFWITTGHSRYTLGLIDQLSLLVGGLVAFIYVIFLESYYRQSVAHRDPKASRDAATPTRPQIRLAQWLAGQGLVVLLRRFAVTIAVPLILLILAWAMNELAWRAI